MWTTLYSHFTGVRLSLPKTHHGNQRQRHAHVLSRGLVTPRPSRLSRAGRFPVGRIPLLGPESQVGFTICSPRFASSCRRNAARPATPPCCRSSWRRVACNSSRTVSGGSLIGFIHVTHEFFRSADDRNWKTIV